VYPEGQLASQVLGFVNADDQGQYGIEGKLNDKLKGKDGVLQSVTDVNDVPLTIGNKNINQPAVNGENVVLSIDRNIQSYTEQALAAGLKRTGATNGSVIVMDPQTGKVMAMANLPTYDPTNYGKVQDASDFLNDTVSVPYEAGSVIKSLTVATGIDKGVITPTSTYYNKGTIDVDDITIQNASLTEVLGTQTMQTALTWSLNTGMVTIAERLGDGSNITRQARDTIYNYFHDKFGFGQLTGIELAGEEPGSIISPESQQGNAVRYSNMVFGQGMDVTMLQAASAFGSVINGGVYHDPTVVAGKVSDDGTYIPNAAKPSRQVIQKSTSDQVRQMLVTDRHDNGGADRPGYMTGGKTGTSQALVNGVYSFNQTTGSYLGFGGDDAPRYVIMVQVSGKNMALGGAKDAGPIFTDISNWMLGYLKLAPKA
jgi:cell division protein FtsI/penicillin-binding protein 2